MIFFCLFIVVDIAEVFLGGNDRDVCVASWQCAGPVVVEDRVTRCVPTTRGTLPPISISTLSSNITIHLHLHFLANLLPEVRHPNARRKKKKRAFYPTHLPTKPGWIHTTRTAPSFLLRQKPTAPSLHDIIQITIIVIAATVINHTGRMKPSINATDGVELGSIYFSNIDSHSAPKAAIYNVLYIRIAL